MPKLLDLLFPPRKLTLVLADKERSRITFSRDRKGIVQFYESPEQHFRLQDIHLYLAAEERGKISEGAIGGAFAAAMMDKDVLTGAIIGDWWEKQNDTHSRKVMIDFKNLNHGDDRQIEVKLTYQQYQKVRRFFQLA
ncbi:hypothetical protein [Streptococcus saliviloxodontae]|uniref:Uncharacterized protein n=1 Tax=Streptococcus saliviloxodontae TaxID=1349416 RepID=A0ABS2PP80_9STRE|nr:hypothetical protein [Streptococcus saliviloxodontae]MBM7636916.1 hypothetical protein [Streptococcus saliviloxodontae]